VAPKATEDEDRSASHRQKRRPPRRKAAAQGDDPAGNRALAGTWARPCR